MKSDYIASAIGQADDKYIDEYAAFEPEKKKAGILPMVLSLAAAAAVLIFVFMWVNGMVSKNHIELTENTGYAGGDYVNTQAVYPGDYVDPGCSLKDNISIYGNKDFSDYVQKDVYSYSDGSVKYEIKEMIWDGFNGKTLMKYTALDDAGRQWIKEHHMDGTVKILQTFYYESRCNGSEETFMYPCGSCYHEEGDDTGFSVAYFIGDFGIPYNKDYVHDGEFLLEFRMPEGNIKADLSAVKKLETKVYKVEKSKEYSQGSFFPSYITTTGLTTWFYFEGAVQEKKGTGPKYSNYTEADGYQLRISSGEKSAELRLTNTDWLKLTLTGIEEDKKYGTYYFTMNGVSIYSGYNSRFEKPDWMSDELWDLKSLGGTYNFMLYESDTYFTDRYLKDIGDKSLNIRSVIIDPDCFETVTAFANPEQAGSKTRLVLLDECALIPEG